MALWQNARIFTAIMARQHTTKRHRTFSTDPFFFGRYYITNILFYFTATAVTLSLNGLLNQISPWWFLSLVPLFLTRFRYIIAGGAVLSSVVIWQFAPEITWITGVLLIAALYIGHLSAVFIHNASHRSFKPVWLNGVIGELCALQQLSAGLVVFQYIHGQHHAYPDDPVRDPHPPKGKTFWEFVDTARVMVGNRLQAIYLQKWGDTAANCKKWKLQNILLLTARFSKTLFVFSLLGPKWFALLFIPSYVSNVFIFAAFNYFSHRERPDGTMEVKDLQGNLYWDTCNRILFGVMYHKSHHDHPRAFNPMSYVAKHPELSSAEHA